MLRTLKFRLLFAFSIVIYLVITVNVLLIEPVNDANVKTESLHIREVSKNLPARGSLNYDLYVIENNDHYKIGADCADCFYYNDFTSNVKSGQLVMLTIKMQNVFLSSDLKLVVSLTAEGHNYLDSNCVNKEYADEKAYLPVFGIVGLIIIYCLMYYEESKNKRKKQPKPYQIN